MKSRLRLWVGAACLGVTAMASGAWGQPPPAAGPPPKASPADLSPGLRAPDLSSHVMNPGSEALLRPRPEDLRAPDPDNLLVIDTNKGRIVVELAPLVAPASVERVKILARQHFYDGLTFFRVVDNFMDQTGDPKNTGDGGSTLPDLKAEFTFRRGPATPFVKVTNGSGPVTGFVGVVPVESQPDELMSITADGKVSAWGLFCPGVVGMARAGDPNSANSQFYIMRQSYFNLNKQYTAFGRVVAGEEVARAIKVGEPVDPPQDRMIQVRVASDLPIADRPVVRVLDPSSPAFKARAEQARIDRGDNFSVCDIDTTTQAR